MLREDVIVKTTTCTLDGYLFVGADGFPELHLDVESPFNVHYRPATFPAAWELQQAEPDAGLLFCAWRTISEMQFEIAQAERAEAHNS